VILGDTVLVTSPELAIHRQMTQPVSMNLDQVQVATVLKQLAKDTATNLVLDPRKAKEAQVPLSLQLDDVPLETAVRLVAEVAGLKPVRMGNVIFVTTKDRATELRADPELSPTPAPPGYFAGAGIAVAAPPMMRPGPPIGGFPPPAGAAPRPVAPPPPAVAPPAKQLR
jgi:hypothetical protein